MIKKLLKKIYWKLYVHYQRKARKYLYKVIGAKKYLFDKKLLKKIHCKLYVHYQRKARKYWYKVIGAKKYMFDKKMKKELKAYFNNDKDTINSLYGKMCYSDTDSVDINSSYPSVMKKFKFSIK